MKTQLEKIRQAAKDALDSFDTKEQLEEARIKYLGKKGELTAILKQMGKLSSEERPVIGQLANEIRADIEEKIATAAKVQEAKVEEHKEEVQKAIENNVAQYISDKKAGKQVTQDDLQSNINASLAGLGGIADVVSNLFVANSELNV